MVKAIVSIISVEKRKNRGGGDFYLSNVLLDDGEEYSLASTDPPKTGDYLEAWFDEKYNKAKAAYP